jgi:hypothetical protein
LPVPRYGLTVLREIAVDFRLAIRADVPREIASSLPHLRQQLSDATEIIPVPVDFCRCCKGDFEIRIKREMWAGALGGDWLRRGMLGNQLLDAGVNRGGALLPKLVGQGGNSYVERLA